MSSAQTAIVFGGIGLAAVGAVYATRVFRSPDLDWRREFPYLAGAVVTYVLLALLLLGPPWVALLGIPAIMATSGYVLLRQDTTPRARVAAWSSIGLAVLWVILLVIRLTVLQAL